LHILRRTAATLNLQAGTNLRNVQAVLGRSSPLMTMTRYAIPDVAAQTEGSSRVADAIFGTTRPQTGHLTSSDEQQNLPDEEETP
jgi:hypothetical protein